MDKEKINKYLEEIADLLNDPNHKRIVLAYKCDDPVNSMELELNKILIEVLNNEN